MDSALLPSVGPADVFVQGCSPVKPLPAVAHERLLLEMPSDMPAEDLGVAEDSATLPAGEVLGRLVRLQVAREVGAVTVGLAALGTLEGTLGRVRHQVALELV